MTDHAVARHNAARSDVRAELDRILRTMMPDAPEDVTDEMLLGDDLGMDSLRLLELAAVVEQRFGLPPVDMEQAITVSTVGDVLVLVEDLCARARV